MKKYKSLFIIFMAIFYIFSYCFDYIKLYAIPNKNINTENTKRSVDKIEIKPSFSRSLKEGGVDTTPSDVPLQSIKPNTILISLDIKDLRERGETTFYYLKSRDEKVTFKIKSFEIGFKGNYEIYSWEDNTWKRKESEFKIYTGSSSIPNYYDIETYKKEYNNKTHGITDDSSSKDVTFIFGKSQGFSFKDNDNKVHFKVSSKGDNIDIVLDNIEEGYLYNFYAESKNMEGHANAFTGINTNTFNSIPFSTNHLEDLNNKDNNGIIEFKNDKYILDYKNGEFTAKEEVGISIRFDEPMSLWINKSKEPNCSSLSKLKENNQEYSMEMSIRMLDNRTGETKNDQLKIKIKDIINLTEKQEEVEIENSLETKPKPSKEKDGSFVKLLSESKNYKPGRIELRLNGLKPCTLFSNVEIESEIKLKSGEDILTKSSKEVPFGKVFTFLEYKFVYRSNAFFAEVVPYKHMKGLYSLVMNNNIVLQQFGDHSKNVYLCLPITTKETYQIYFAPEKNLTDDGNTNLKKMVYSEKSMYKPDELDIDFNAPTDFKIVDYNLRAIHSNNSYYGSEGIISMKLRWGIGRSEDIKKMLESAKDNTVDVEYNLNKSLVPKKEKTVSFAKVYLNIKKISESNYEATYKVIDLKTEKELDSNIYKLKEIDGKYYMETEFEIEGKRKKDHVENEEKDLTFYYPRIYFLNVGLISEIVKDSLFDSLTLDDILKLKLPNPKDLREITSSLTKSSFEISWSHSGKQLLEFIKNNGYSFENNKLKFFVNLYITEDIEKIKEISKLEEIEDRKEYAVNFNFKEMGNNPISFKGKPIENLRKLGNESKILRIEGLDLSKYEKDIKDEKDFIPKLLLEDLDNNQKYYLSISLGLKLETEDGKIIELESIISKILGVTTKDKEKIPGDEDKIPFSPKIFIKDISQDRAVVYWEYVDTPKDDKNINISYQIIRTKNKQIDEKYLNTYKDIDFYYELLKKDLPDTEKIFLETNDKPNKEGKYAPNIFDGKSFTQADISKFELNYTAINLELKDNTLSSNQIYFYYVRTVRKVGNKVKYSIWSVENCTTSKLKNPINLSIETNRNDYDRKTEFVIKFDAPIKNLDILGKEYILQYSLKEEDGEFLEPQIMDSTKLKENSSKSKLDGYITFIYKISNLKSGKSYSIKVRLKSLVTGDISSYSNIATTRTDMNQDEYENEKNIEKWVGHFKEELNKLKKYPYWIVKNSNEELIAVYRQVMFPNIINDNQDSTIELVRSIKNANKHIYYIPYISILDAIKEDKSFKINLNNIDIIIPAKSFNEDSNEEINRLLYNIKNKKIEDLYIKLIIKESKNIPNINNYDPLTNKIDIDFESVSSIASNIKWDKDILDMYTKEIDRESSSIYIKNYIKESIDRKKTNEEMLKYIAERIEYIKSGIIDKVRNSLNRTLKSNYYISSIDQNMSIIFKDNNKSVIKGFIEKNSFNWTEKEIIDFGDYKGINTNLPGSYIFAGKNIVISGLENKNDNKIVKIISKYDLSDILGENFINSESFVTKEMALNITARMSGASKKNNSKKFLSSKGYDITNLNNKSIISLEEYIYLMMLIYEIRTNINIDTIYIRNNISLDGIKDINKKYEKSIKAAIELGLYKNIEDTKLNSKITIKDMLEMLSELESKSKSYL